MHEIAEIIVPPTDDVTEYISKIMDEFKSEEEGGGGRGYRAFWDFYIIGGRFSGHKQECAIEPSLMEAFQDELLRRKVTVSGVQCGKQELNPASQIAMVDALWREMIPGHGDKCILFSHSRYQYRKDGYYPEDVCTIAKVPERLFCSRLIVSGPHWKEPGMIQAARMWCVDYWNGVEHQKSGWDGNVKRALAAMKEDRTGLPKELTDDWLVVTVDYHC